MKAKNQILYLLAAGMFCMTSCVKHGDVYQPRTPESTADLVVPEGFEWSSSRTVSLAVQSPVATVASFFVDEACTPENQIATLAVPEGKTTFEFDIPNENTAIYVQYTSTDGTTKTLKSAINGVKSKAIEGAEDLFMDEPEATSQGPVQLVNIPKGDRYGTLMFEDKWPETGDFDFNDVVVNYRINATYNPVGADFNNPQNPANDIVIKVDLKIRALGGLYPYDFAIQIGQTRSHEGSSIKASHLGEISLLTTTNDNITVEKLEGTEFPAVIVKGLDALRSSSYYNTISKTDEGVNVSFEVKIKGTIDEQDNRMRNSAFSDPKAFDYFLINTETHREIHLKGFKPTALYTNYDAENTAGGEYYYENDAHLVWGLKVPQEIGWAKEKQDILKVYTRFEEWVTSGGKALEPDNATPLMWYKHHSDENYIQP